MVALLDASIIDLAAFAGMEMENMTRGHGWRFLAIGRRVERAANMGSLVKAALAVQSSGHETLEPVLEIADSVMTYRRRYFSQPQWAPALDLLLADEANPRSLAFQIFALGDHAAGLRDGVLRLKKAAAIRKGIRGDVEDAHHQRAAQGEQTGQHRGHVAGPGRTGE